jgi:hypothetical protein
MGIAPVGLLIIRIWHEEGSERPLRIEVRVTGDTRCGFERALAFSEGEPVEALVRAWLAEVLARSDEFPPGQTGGSRSRDGHAAVTGPRHDRAGNRQEGRR